ncbi:hypothetical protein K491DRAFT_696788 [Lophiostoma macrostomum CBS 122681]|uniref:BYS1 domain protein n=1 Tax=Lophiostoma macrostomum CBS 122681 TaxID=1314788 RepID=A0A6A6SVK3_9PLEO|nr:hypothetical protein K491DRAFT_696788 [Lophiostoma macrostomum CBS 122681]
MLFLAALLLSLLTPLITASSFAIQNNCDQTLYLWSVGGTTGPQYEIAPGDRYLEKFYSDASSGGISVEISKVADGINQGAPRLVLAYNLDYPKLWYDLVPQGSSPFAGQLVDLSGDGCPEIEWVDGERPDGSTAKICWSYVDMELSLCKLDG